MNNETLKSMTQVYLKEIGKKFYTHTQTHVKIVTKWKRKLFIGIGIEG